MALVQTFKVLNMNCNHCVKTIDKALKANKEIDSIAYNLEEKKIKVKGSASAESIVQILKDAGYEVGE